MNRFRITMVAIFIFMFTSWAAAQWFIDVATDYGVNNNEDCQYAAWGDYNNDGYEDLLVANAYGDQTIHYFKLYQNLGGNGFEDVSEHTGITLDHGCYCAVWGDYNNDALLDIYFCQGTPPPGECPAPNRLYKNIGNGNFEDVTEAAFGEDNNIGTTFAAVWGDVDNDGWLDLYVLNQETPWCDFDADLYLGNGTSFSRVTDLYNVGNDRVGRAAAMADYDDDGDLDIYVCNDFDSPNRLYMNKLFPGPFDFEDIAYIYQIDYPYMYSSGRFFDFDNDLDFDQYLVSEYLVNNLLKWEDFTYDDVAFEWGVLGTNIDSDCSIEDFDNDGDWDIYVTNHNPLQGDQSNILYRKDPDRYEDVAYQAGVAGDRYSNTASWADFNNDGLMDLYVGNASLITNSENYLYQNVEATDMNYLHVKLQGTSGNFNGIGARVYVYWGSKFHQMRQVEGGSGRSQSSLPVEFGCGYAKDADSVVVRWPGGATSLFEKVATNQRITIVEPGYYDIADLTWDARIHGNYYISGDVTFRDRRLTIKQGTKVYFHKTHGAGQPASLIFDGEAVLDAFGVESERVGFYSQHEVPAPGDWRCIRLKGVSIANLEYCDLIMPDFAVISESRSSLDMSNCLIVKCFTGGIYGYGPGAGDHLIRDSEFLDCSQAAISLISGNPVITGNNISGVVRDGIKYYGGGNLTIDNNTISTNYIYSDWGISVSNSSGPGIPNPAISATEIRGFDGGIRLENTENLGVIRDQVRLYYNGSYGIYLQNSSPMIDGINANQANIIRNSYYGIYCGIGCEAKIRWTKIRDNEYSVYIVSGARPDLGTLIYPGNNSIEANDRETGPIDLYNQDLNAVEARYNYWGVDGPEIVGFAYLDPALIFDPIPLGKISGDEQLELPDNFISNYPNPFNSHTEIKFGIKKAGHVTINIYSISGAVVKTLVDGDLSAGVHNVTWNGTDNAGKPISSGIYLYSMHTADENLTKKMLLLK